MTKKLTPEELAKRKKTNKKILLGFVLPVVVFLAIVGIITQEDPEDLPIEYKMAQIEYGAATGKDDPRVDQIRQLLTEISVLADEPVENIADQTFFAQKKLREEHGKEYAFIFLLQEARTVLQAEKLQYAQLMALFMVTLAH